MDEKAESTRLKRVIMIVAVTCIVITVICLCIWLGKKIGDDGTDEDANGVSAYVVNEGIVEKLRNDPDYTSIEAESDYKKAFDNAEGEEKLAIAIYYAKYDYSVYGEIDEAVKILEQVEPLAKSLTDKSAYYLALRDLYEANDNQDKADYYNQLVAEMMTVNDNQVDGTE